MACCNHFLSLTSMLPSTTPTLTFPAGHDETGVNDPGVRGRRKLVATAHLCAGVCLRARIYLKFFMMLRGTITQHLINFSIRRFSCSVKFWALFVVLTFACICRCTSILIISYMGKDMWRKLISETSYCYLLAVKCLWKWISIIKNESAHLQLCRGNCCCFVTLQETRVIFKHQMAK